MDKESLAPQAIVRMVRAVKNVYRNFLEDKCLVHAGNLAYIGILSLVPLIVVGISLFSAYGISPRMKAAILNIFIKHMLPQTAENAAHYIDTFVSNSKALGLSGMIVLIFLSYSLFNAVQGAFQTIWGLRKKRSIIQNVLVFTNVLFWTPLLMGISVYLKTRLEFVYHTNVVTEFILTAMAFLLPLAGFTMAYQIIPAVKVRLRSAVLGGVVASVFWFFLLHGFDFYVKYTQSMKTLSKLYGSLVIIPIFLAWIYLCWLITFIGAEVASYHQFTRLDRSEEKEVDFFKVVAILGFLASRFEEGKGAVDTTEILARWPDSEPALKNLVNAGYLYEADGAYLPARPPDKILLVELLEKFTSDKGIAPVYKMIEGDLKDKTLKDCLV